MTFTAYGSFQLGLSSAMVAALTLFRLAIGSVVWEPMHNELGIGFDDFDNSFAANLAGLGVGSIFLVPFAINYGRRPVYIASSLLQLSMMIWQARVQTAAQLIAVNVVSGVAGSINECIVQMTIADLFFVHQRATMNAVYLLTLYMGTFLAPVCAGYISVAQGWRWIWWWATIFVALSLVLFIFFYEETKYAIRVQGTQLPGSQSSNPVAGHPKPDEREKPTGMQRIINQMAHDERENPADLRRYMTNKTHAEDQGSPEEYPRKPLRERLALVTKQPMGASYFVQIWEFLKLFSFPAISYAALIWGSILAWFSVVLTTVSEYFPLPPYNFSPSSVGLLNLPIFIGGLIGLFFAPLSDRLILRLARRNKGIFEPEMRLWMATPGIILLPFGMLMYGLSLVHGSHWTVPSIGLAILGVGMSFLSDNTLTYVQDCYSEIVGSALVSITLVRNIIPCVLVFALPPWITSMGLRNMFITATCLALVTLAPTIPVIIWGKKIRTWSADQYESILAKNGMSDLSPVDQCPGVSKQPSQHACSKRNPSALLSQAESRVAL